MNKLFTSIRAKLISIFVLIKVLPLVALAWFAWNEITGLTTDLNKRYHEITSNTLDVLSEVSTLSTHNSIRALDLKSRESIEQLSTNTARQVASFLYDRDKDILLASKIPITATQYHDFLASRSRQVIMHHPWVLDEQGVSWKPEDKQETTKQPLITHKNPDNKKDFHYRPQDQFSIVENRPLYLEITFVDTDGNEIIKEGNSSLLSPERRNVADPGNTFCKAETYFEKLKKLKPGEIYVSEVIGPYVSGHFVGTYSKTNAQKKNIEFAPEKSGYAGKENPVGIRFRGIVRWATPVVENERIIGYVTLALDHTHIMEFTDHIVPTAERYSPISDAGSGNYAFMWDYKGRNISHPRDYFIVGYDQQTGKQTVPWLDEEMYEIWQQNEMSMDRFFDQAPQFKEQMLEKKPAPQLTNSGMLGLDCRYLNFAPQCTGWFTLTQDGGSGSFVIFWSGLWKLTTAAAIPYYTGIYGKTPRGFGFVTIGANVDEFHSSATETAQSISKIEHDFSANLEGEKRKNLSLMQKSIEAALHHLTFYTLTMVIIVIFIAIFMAGALTSRITSIIAGFRRFQKGEHSYRLERQSNDEMGELSQAYNDMADTIQKYISDVNSSRTELEELNRHLTKEIEERRTAQHELSLSRDNLEKQVRERTHTLELEIKERIKAEKLQREIKERLRKQNSALQQLAGNQSLFEGDLASALDTISELAADILQVDRCGVWLLDDQETMYTCRKLIVDGSSCEAEEQSLSRAEFPHFASELTSQKFIVAHDAGHNESLHELAVTYLGQRGIKSLLTSSISTAGKAVGFVAFSQVSSSRQWHLDEINFANSIADMIGLAIGAANQKDAINEKEKLTARLQHAEKMEAIGTLAGGVAHDLNNILSGVVSYPELLLQQLPEESKLREPIKTILKSGKRAATIVQDLLTLARRGVAITNTVNLNNIIEEYLGSPEYSKLLSYHQEIQVKTELEKDLKNVLGSPVHLTKTLMNLVSNASEAIKNTGDVIISTTNCYLDQPIKGYKTVKEGAYVALTVKDTGIGISHEDLHHIFEPFYTKKKMGRSGTGLGMAVVWGTVKDHHGYIDFESTEGKGSRFTIYLPVTDRELEETPSKDLDEYQGNGETILVIDDVEEQREIASAILETLGYQVVTVDSGEAAVDYLTDHRVDLIILDMIMDPGIDGLDTYKQILQINPNQKAIIASGFSETARLKEVLRLGASTHLKKPYALRKIGAVTKSVLTS